MFSLNRIKLAKNYLLRRLTIDVYPSSIGVESTSRCNINCIMCPRQEITRQMGDMDMDVYRKIISDIKGKTEFIWFQQYGEPFLQKNIFEMIEYAKRNGLKTGISSNATLLTEKNIDGIIRSGLDYIIFAFDGATKETYEKVRKGANFERVSGNIRNFIKFKLESKANIFTVLQCIYMEDTEKEIDDFMSAWRVKGVDGIRIRQVTYSGNKGKFKNRLDDRPCYWLWTDPPIQHDGTVVPCCQDVNAAHPLGNIKDMSLGEIWNSEKMVNLRKMHIDGRYKEIDICKNCNMYQPILLLVVGSSFFTYATVSKLVPKVETIISRVRY